MKKIILPVFFSLSLNLYAQGIMPVPMDAEPKTAIVPTCRPDPGFTILSDSLLRPFQLDLSGLMCNEEEIYADAFSLSTNYVHNAERCEQVAHCSNSVTDAQIKEAENIIADNLSRAVLLGVFTKEVLENRDYNMSLLQYEQKNKVTVCEAEAIDFDCYRQLRMTLATVADSLVDFPEFDRAPASDDDLQTFLSNKFFNKQGRKPVERTLADLKKNCSKKLSLKKICEKSEERLAEVNTCDKTFLGKNCFEHEQRAWASITNDLKSDHSLFLAIEKQLCLSTRVSQTSVQPVPAYLALTNPRRQRSLADKYIRTQHLVSMAQLNAQSTQSTAESEKEIVQNKAQDKAQDKAQERDGSPSDSGVIKQEKFAFGEGLKQAAANNNGEEVIHDIGSRDSMSLSDSFSHSMDEAISENSKVSNSNSLTNNTGTNWNSEILNRARVIAEEQKAQAEEQKRKQEESNADSFIQSDKKKKEEVDALMSQISSLKTKLDDMNSKVEELKGKKTAAEGETADKESLEREAAILDLKKKIAELEADKKKKETEAKAARDEEEARLARNREEKIRSANTASVTFAGRTSYVKQTGDQSADAAAVREREKTAGSIANSNSSSDGGRAPASVGGASGGSSVVSSQLVLKAVGAQASPESNVVYMTANELQRYPYRLSDTASPVDIEKMLEGNNGSTIIIGESEQIVPILVNGAVVLDENGKIKFKRVKISLVKNDKEKKQQIAREISSVADLKKEEQRKRDLIRYQEMKKALKLK